MGISTQKGGRSQFCPAVFHTRGTNIAPLSVAYRQTNFEGSLEPAFLAGSYRVMDHREDLVQANRHVADAEGRIERQRALIAAWASKNRDTAEAELMLQNMLNLLEQLKWHRAQIEAELSERNMTPLKRVNGD
jgi:hypothetical protein